MDVLEFRKAQIASFGEAAGGVSIHMTAERGFLSAIGSKTI
jgi:hypothetical protein